MATVLCALLAFPLAYVIAFKAGRYKNLILRPGDPAVLRDLPDPHHRVENHSGRRRVGGQRARTRSGCCRAKARLLSTSWAVIGGLTYNWIIFMILPLYVSLEKIDPRLIEASKDLYSSNTRSFTKVILPLSMPGVLAGSMLVFIPAIGRLHQRRLSGQHANDHDRQRHSETVPGGQGLSRPRPR